MTKEQNNLKNKNENSEPAEVFLRYIKRRIKKNEKMKKIEKKKKRIMSLKIEFAIF